MNFCSNCGQKLNGANYCPNCGMKIKRDENVPGEVPPAPAQVTYYPQQNSYYSTQSTFNTQHIPPQSNSDVFLANLFSEKDEKHIYTFGNEQYIQFLNTGKAKKAFAILSDKRLYIRGKRYEIRGKGHSSPDKRGKAVKTEKVIDVKDVKTVEIGRVGRAASFLYMYYAIITTVLAVAAFVISRMAAADSVSEAVALFTFLTIVFAAVAGALWFSFAMSINSCISLLCNDTWIRFPLEKYVGREGYALMRHIIILQMPYREQVSEADSNYGDSIFSKDGKLTVKNKKIEPKEWKGEITVGLKDITDIEVFKPSRDVLDTVLTILFLTFGSMSIIYDRYVFINMIVAMLFGLLLLAIPSKQLRLKVACNNTWFSFTIKNRREGADIMRYIVEQQAHNELKLSKSHTNV